MDRSKFVREGAMFLALYLLLAIISLTVPVIGVISFLLLPVPFVFFTYKYELIAGITLALFSTFLLFIIAGPLALPLSLLFAISGVVIGELYRRKLNAFGVLIGGALSYIFSIVIIYVGSIAIVGVDPIAEIQTIMIESAEVTEEMFFLVEDGGSEALDSVYEFVDDISIIAPSLMIILGVGIAFIVQIIAAIFLRRAKHDVIRFPPLREWGFPKAFIWYYLVTYIIIFIGVEEGTIMYTAVANLTPILEIVMIIQGFALVFFYFHMKKITFVFPMIIVVISFLFPIFLHIVRILGIIDLGFELRKRMNLQK